MRREFFNQQFAALVSAYTVARRLPAESQDVYWEMLQDIPEDKFAHGVKECLASSKFFPTIAELGDASLPPIRDKKAPLPPVDHPFKMLNWREQIERQQAEQAKIDNQPRRQIAP